MPSSPRGSLRSERGSASVVVVAVIGAMLAVLAATLAVSVAQLGQRRAATAADLAALAAADAAVGRVGGEPCSIAERVAGANGAALDGCTLTGVVADVSVGVALPGGWRATGRARAGPGPADQSKSVSR